MVVGATTVFTAGWFEGDRFTGVFGWTALLLWEKCTWFAPKTAKSCMAQFRPSLNRNRISGRLVKEQRSRCRMQLVRHDQQPNCGSENSTVNFQSLAGLTAQRRARRRPA